MNLNIFYRILYISVMYFTTKQIFSYLFFVLAAGFIVHFCVIFLEYILSGILLFLKSVIDMLITLLPEIIQNLILLNYYFISMAELAIISGIFFINLNHWNLWQQFLVPIKWWFYPLHIYFASFAYACQYLVCLLTGTQCYSKNMVNKNKIEK